jgi:hypothetical protein
MPVGYSFDTEEDQELNPLATKAAGPQATQNPLANMAGAASPGLTSPFDSTFGPMMGAGAGGAAPATSPDGGAMGPGYEAQKTAGPPAIGLGGGGPNIGPGGPQPGGFLDPWSAFTGESARGQTPGFEQMQAPQPQTGSDQGGRADRPTPGLEQMGPGGGVGAPQQTGLETKGPEVGASQPGAGGSDKSAEITTRFKDMAAQLASATDPQHKAVLQDKLSRDIFGSLSDAGHDVKWDGDQIVVDGRKYIVGGTAATAPGPTAASGAMPANGYEDAKWKKAAAGQSDSAKYIVSESVSRIASQLQAIPDEAGRKAFIQQHLQTLVPQLEQQGWKVHEVRGEKMLIEGHGDPPHWADAVEDIEGKALPAWTTDLDQRNGAVDDPRAMLFDEVMTPRVGGASDVETRMPTPLSGPMTVPTGATAAPTGPAGTTGGGYTPGTIDDRDLDGLSMDDILARIGRPTEPGALDTDYQSGQVESDYAAGKISNDPLNLGRIGNYEQGSVTNDPLDTYSFDGKFKGNVGDELGALGAGATDTETEDLILSILQNPESFPPHVVEMLKAQSKDELAEMQNQEDEDLTAAGYATGNADSNWLASEKLASAGRRDQALVGSNRSIDLTAAEKNMADKRAAAGLGNEFANSRSQRLLAERGQRFEEAATGEGLEQSEVASKQKAAQYDRDGQLINEELRGSAFDRNADATKTNAGLTTQEAAFQREGELANEALRDKAFGNRTGSQTTNEQLRAAAADRNLKASQQNIDNQFRSAEERRTAVALAADTTLKTAAQKGDRRALEEAFKQKAAELGQSADKIRQDFILATLQDSTQRRGQDIGSETSRFLGELGASVDRAKLAQAGIEFQQDLIFRLMALRQADEQFGAQYGLDVAKTQHTIDEDHYNRFADTFGD